MCFASFYPYKISVFDEKSLAFFYFNVCIPMLKNTHFCEMAQKFCPKRTPIFEVGVGDLAYPNINHASQTNSHFSKLGD